jgi:ATP-dependent phosphoenolpyruvate carboxykinase
MLRALVERHHVDCWLVNTGWTGGGYGAGRRMPIRVTRRLLAAALDGSLSKADFRHDPYFGFAVPTSVPGVEPHILYPVKTWQNKASSPRPRSGCWRCSPRTSSASRAMSTTTCVQPRPTPRSQA